MRKTYMAVRPVTKAVLLWLCGALCCLQVTCWIRVSTAAPLLLHMEFNKTRMMMLAKRSEPYYRLCILKTTMLN